MLNQRRIPLKKKKQLRNKELLFGHDLGDDVISFPIPSKIIEDAKYYMIAKYNEDKTIDTNVIRSYEDLQKSIDILVESNLVAQVMCLLFVIREVCNTFAKENNTDVVMIKDKEYIISFLDMSIYNTLTVMAKFIAGKNLPRRKMEIEKQSYMILEKDILSNLKVGQ